MFTLTRMALGLIYIAFGREYIRLAESTIPYTKRFTNLPVTLIVNRPCKIPSVNVVYVKMRDSQNREIKTQLHKWTPYDRTLYLDVDSVIQRKGIEKVFDFDSDIVLNKYLRWEKGDKVLNIYDRCMKKFDVKPPITIYNGAFILFKKKPQFFDVWHSYWKKFGSGREMPPLACAVKKSGVSYENFKIKIAVDSLNPDAMIQHDCNNFLKQFNFPKFTRQTPFDSNPSDFRWTNF